MKAPRTLNTSSGKRIVVDSLLGRGGEGEVFSVNGNPTLAAKLYHKDKVTDRKDKIIAMTSGRWHEKASNVAFPIDALFDASGQFVGFTMARVGGRKPVERISSPTSRKTDFPKANFALLVRVGLNIARALASVNATGCVVGDINHSGVLVSEDATVVLIDCDSFQVTAAGRNFHCKVGVPEFTPPELQGKRLDNVQRTQNHDAFGLAVLLFNLLFMGRHPFAGKFLGKSDIQLEQAIAEFRFAYSSRASQTLMQPPPSVPSLADLPPGLGQAFERAFGPAGAQSRPLASDWVQLLSLAENQVVSCKDNSSHQYFRNAARCPWCVMERGYPGFVAFPNYAPGDHIAPSDLSQLIAAVGGINVPDAVGALRSHMPVFNGPPSVKLVETSKSWKLRYFGGLIGAACSLQLFYVNSPGPLLGVVSLGSCAWLALRQWDVIEPYRKATQQSLSLFEDLERRWQSSANIAAFLQGKRSAQDCITALQNLGVEEQRRLNDLKNQLRARQQNAFLEKFYIDRAAIKGIGNARKLTLRSYGVETAADVSASRIKNIPGFGPKIAGEIVAWRTALERKFVFDPRQPVNPSDIATVKAEIAKERLQKHTALRDWLMRLRSQAANVIQSREQLKSSAIPVWKQLRQAELDEQVIRAQLPSSPAHKWGFGIAVFFAFIVLANLNSKPTQVKALNSRRETSSPQTTSWPKPSTTPPSISRSAPPSIDVPAQSQPPAQRPFDINLMPKPPEPAPVTMPSLSPATNPSPQTPLAPTAVPTETSPPIAALRSLNVTDDVAWVQKRLAGLGYLRRYAPGILDKDTRDALRDFRVINKLGTNDTWDTDTQRSIEKPLPVSASESFLGSWSESPQCDVSAPPITITSRRAQSSSGGYCDFLSMNFTESGWQMRTRCTDSGESWTATIRFSVSASQLIWDGRTGVTKYFRCR